MPTPITCKEFERVAASIRSHVQAWLLRLMPCAAALLWPLTQPLNAQQQTGSEAVGISVGELIVYSGFIGWVLVALSVVALAVVIENYVSLKREKLAPPQIIDEIQALFDEGQFQEAMELCENQQTFLTRVCAAGIAKIGHSYEVMEKSIAEMGDEEAVKLHQKVGWLPLIANVAPMLGLLGTVWGMIISFKTIASMGGAANPADLAYGIYQALITTLFGLLLAIPVTAAFAWMRNNLVRSVIEVGAIIEDLFERFRPAT
jgi:biopolymer transport protein ExbB